MAGAILLDLYRTLVEPDWPRLLAGRDAIARRAGLAPEAARAAWEATHAARMRGGHRSLEGDLAAVLAAAGLDPAPLGDGLLAELATLERANWRDAVRLYPDTIAALERLNAAGARLAIVSNASAEAASVIPALGLDRLVELVLTSCAAGVLKPELFAVALRRLGVGPAQATLVDDDPEQVAAAGRMGIRAVLVRRTDGGPVAGGDAPTGDVAADLSEVVDLLLPAAPGPRR